MPVHRANEWQPLDSSNIRYIFRMSLLKEAREGASLDFFGSFAPRYGLRYLMECFPNQTILNLGNSKCELLMFSRLFMFDIRDHSSFISAQTSLFAVQCFIRVILYITVMLCHRHGPSSGCEYRIIKPQNRSKRIRMAPKLHTRFKDN